MERYVAAMDQGTTSTRCILFDQAGRLVSVAQREHPQHYPQPGWVEHDAAEIWRNVHAARAARRCAQAGRRPRAGRRDRHRQPARDDACVWDRATPAVPVGRAVVWQDTRTDALVEELAGDRGADRFRDRCGLPLATYFAGPRLRWLLDHTPGLRERAERGEVLFGTMETWLIWNLTGGPTAACTSPT